MIIMNGLIFKYCMVYAYNGNTLLTQSVLFWGYAHITHDTLVH